MHCFVPFPFFVHFTAPYNFHIVLAAYALESLLFFESSPLQFFRSEERPDRRDILGRDGKHSHCIRLRKIAVLLVRLLHQSTLVRYVALTFWTLSFTYFAEGLFTYVLFPRMESVPTILTKAIFTTHLGHKVVRETDFAIEL